MALRLGDVAPNFSAATTEGTIDFHQWLGDSWGVLFSHPADYTPVCTTELGAAARAKAEFEKRNVKVIAVSVDALESHQGWLKDINETQSVTMNFPIIADPDRIVATTYDMIHPNVGGTATVRSVFFIGPDKKVKVTLTYPDETGRSFTEILRLIDALQLTANHRVATPADWQQGQDCIISLAVSDPEAEKLFPIGVRKLKPYLRYTPQPPINPNQALRDADGFTRTAEVAEPCEIQDQAKPPHAQLVEMARADWCANGFGELLYSVETGKSGVEKHLGMPICDWLAHDPEMASLFSETMVGFHGAESAAVAAAYDFSNMKTTVDVGGATGNLLTAVLSRAPGARGILYDLPHVVRDAPALIQARGLTDRVTIEAGSFFERVPAGGDAYLLTRIIHDWSKAQCLTILGHCRRAMNPNGRLLLIEMVLPAGNAPHPGKVLDMMMFVGPGGQERTDREYVKLLEKAGFRLTRVVPTEAAVSVIEAVPDTGVDKSFAQAVREPKPYLRNAATEN